MRPWNRKGLRGRRPAYIPQHCRPCADHTGRRFASVSEMARAWGLSPVLYHNRRRRKWSLERALTVPVGQRRGRKRKEAAHVCP